MRVMCPGWGDGRDGSACDKGYEASPYTYKAVLPLRICPTCKGTGYVEVDFK